MVEIVAKEKETTGFGERLKALRNAAGLTLEQLGQRVGMRHQSITRLESGSQDPNWRTVIKLAKALGCSPDDFLPED